MTDPVQFPSRTDTIGLPLLFAGQAQKEFFINQAFSQIDTMLRGAVAGEFDLPPAGPADGTAYIVGSNAQNEWDGREGMLALRIAGSWQFVPPQRGMHVFDRTAGCMRIFRNEWSGPSSVSPAEGGTNIDAEARSAIDGIIVALQNAGIITA